MAKVWEEVRRRLAPVSLRLWPALSNSAWEFDTARAQFGDRLRIEVAPDRVTTKIDGAAAASCRSRFLVSGLDRLPSTAVKALYTYRDMEDICLYGENWRATRLGQWLSASIAAGRPPMVRGEILRDDAQIQRYYRVYLDMFRSMQANGYRYDGKDEMCFGIGAEGRVVLMRRGTHRLAAAQILRLPAVAGTVTQIDQAFARSAVQRFPESGASAAIVRAIQALAQS